MNTKRCSVLKNLKKNKNKNEKFYGGFKRERVELSGETKTYKS